MVNDSTNELRDTLLAIRSAIEATSINKKGPEQDMITYRDEVVPKLLQLRRLNRTAKDKLESKFEKVNELNARLDRLHCSWENVSFEASCLANDLSGAKGRLPSTPNLEIQNNGLNEAESAQSEHETRFQLLEVEEKKRMTLKQILSDLEMETNEIEIVCKSSEAELERIKPYIKQLVDQVEPIRDGNKIA